MSNLHAMIDLETLGLPPNGCIMEIGMILFTPYSSEKEHVRLSFNIDYKECEALGGTIDNSTLKWWEEQDQLLFYKLKFPDFSTPIRQALIFIKKTIERNKVECVWANSPSFDLNILDYYYKKLEIESPFRFYQQMDVRTVRKMYSILLGEIPDVYPKHSALGDCEYQVNVIKKAYMHINNLSNQLELPLAQ